MAITEEKISADGQEMFDLIDWYEQICLDNSFNDIAMLMQNYARISALSVTQARKYRIVAKNARTFHAQRRINCAIRTTELLETNDGFTGKTFTGVKAEAIALKENQEVYLKEYTNQGEMEGSEIVLKQVGQVLFAMFQHIQELRGTRYSEEKTSADQYA